MSPREQRAIRNEEVFREVNGHIADERTRDKRFPPGHEDLEAESVVEDCPPTSRGRG